MKRPVDDAAARAVAFLAESANADSAAAFPGDIGAVNHAGLYSWWCDERGLADLSNPFSEDLPPLIYAGQTGATTTRSRTERVATLQSRIGGNHLRGNVRSSTFRKTLTAILIDPLGLQLAGADRLDKESNRHLSEWMRTHLRVAILAVEDRSTLADLEHVVLERLDPPLNLMGMVPTPVRARLRSLRSALGSPSGTTAELPRDSG
jgi:hypothetical protein